MIEDRQSILRGAYNFILAIAFILLPVASMPIEAAGGKNGDQHIDTVYQSVFPDRPPVIDGIVSSGEWDKAQSLALEHGVLFFQNDVTNLYLLLDLTSVTQADSTDASPPGSFDLAVDVNGDGEKTTNVDLSISFPSPDQAPCLQFFKQDGVLSSCAASDSSAALGFGPSRLSSVPHRIWELAISLSEISAIPSGIVHLGLRTSSSQAEFDETYPANFPDGFDQFLQIRIAKQDVKLLILSHADFSDALQPLKEYKDETGISSYVQSWQSLDKSYRSAGRDQPERIKLAIAAYARFAGTRYVMLVGDAAHFPVRYTLTDRADEKNTAIWAFSSADFYYADLFKAKDTAFNTWDANNDGYFGELHGGRLTGVMNIDQVGLVPAVAVGRLPVANVDQVKRYIEKIENYERDSYRADWSKLAVFIATKDWVPNACNTSEAIASASLIPNGYSITRLYQPGNPCLTTVSPLSSVISKKLNQGVAFINYLGHGGATSWEIPSGWYGTKDLTELTQTSRLPIVFSAGCYTASYAPLPPFDSYTDVQGIYHSGTASEGIIRTDKSPQPAPLQEVGNQTESLAEQLLVENQTGAIGYIGAVTTTQYPSFELDTLFYESLNHGAKTLGDMWGYMVTRYYQLHPAPDKIDKPDWYQVAIFQQPWKFHLFGDPSLRIQGIPSN